MTDTTTASPLDDDPIVTPTPPIFAQYAGLLAKTPMRPKMNPDTHQDMSPDEQDAAVAAFPDQKAKWIADGKPAATRPHPVSEDSWQASGCQPSCVSMQVAWWINSPAASNGLVVPNKTTDPKQDTTFPLWVIWWLMDQTGDPTTVKYTSSSSHPPWVPKVPHLSGGPTWYVDHDAVAKAPTKMTRTGQPLKLVSVSLSDVAKKESDPKQKLLVKRKALKQALMKCGPIALNMTHPGHYVLLYGYRGRHMYILDPGLELYRAWALGKGYIPVPKGDEAADATVHDHLFATLPPKEKEALYGCNLVIADDAVWSVNSEGAYKGTFLDCIIGAQGYQAPDVPEFSEFRSASAPDGRMPGGLLPATYDPKAPPSPSPSPSPSPLPSPSPSPSPSPPSPVTPAPDPDSPGAQSVLYATGLIDELLALQARAVVTVTDPQTNVKMAGVYVEVTGQQSGRTDKNGVWTSARFPSGSYDLKANRDQAAPPNDDRTTPTQAGQAWQKGVAFAAGDNSLSVSLVDLTNARALITVRERPSRRTLAGVDVEIVSKDSGKTDDNGLFTSKWFGGGKSFDVKVTKAGFGPVPAAGGAATEGAAVRPQVSFARGDVAAKVYVASSSPFVPPPPAAKTKDSGHLRITVTHPAELDYQAFVSGGSSLQFDYSSHLTFSLSAEWTVLDAAGKVVDDVSQTVGGAYALAAEKVASHIAGPGDPGLGNWTFRVTQGSYYDEQVIAFTAPDPPEAPLPGPAPTPTPVVPAALGATSGLGNAITIGQWEQFVGLAVPDVLITQIKAVRKQLPHDSNLKAASPYGTSRDASHCWTLGDFGSAALRSQLTASLLVPARAAEDAALATLQSQGTPANQQAYNDARVHRFLAGTYIRLTQLEGAPAAINTYDKAIVTWGTGFAWSQGMTALVRSACQEEKVKNLFYNCGFRLVDSGFQVVDVVNKKVITDGATVMEHMCDPGQTDDPAAASKIQLLDMLVLAARDGDMSTAVAAANIEVFGLFHLKWHTNLKNLQLLCTQGVATLLLHIHHWGPAMISDPIAYAAKHASLDLTTPPSMEKDIQIALWTVRQVYSGFHPAFNQVQQYWKEMLDDAAAEGMPLPVANLNGADAIFTQKPTTTVPPADHNSAKTTVMVKGSDGKKVATTMYYDLGPLTDYPKT